MQQPNSVTEPIKVIIFGTGSLASDMKKICRKAGYEVVGYADNNSTKWGGAYEGKPVLPPEELQKLQYDKVIIASSFVDEIEPQLLALGVAERDILIYPGRNSPRGIFNLHNYHELHTTWQTLIMPVTNRCNLQCRHCLKGTHLYPSTFTADRDTFLNFMAQFDPGAFHECCVSAEGELTIIPDFADYLHAAKAQGWNNLTIITNGTCRDEDAINRVIGEELLAAITISLEAATQKCFEFIRGYPFDQFMNFLSLLAESRKKYASSIRVSFNAMLCKINIQELAGMVELAARHQIPLITVNPLVPYLDDSIYPERICRKKYILDADDLQRVSTSFAEAEEIARIHGIQLSGQEAIFKSLRATAASQSRAENQSCTCFEPYRVVRVRSDGSVYPCVEMPHQYPLGNLQDHDFLQLWHSVNYETFLRKLKAEPLGSLECCRLCHRAGQGMNRTFNVKRPDYIRQDGRIRLISDPPVKRPEEWLL